ncbi:MAG: tRNA (guanosine(46)-N7)-methyltransferase TrmB [Terrimicrobiaceae bacterium]|jgi:tRNA (guanine-N7-)-methyltransferase|nr:tRNA (guanosine(46)-N7)-methyltransferase TrmB [Terrimicrobiaceae bacterium]
MPEEILVPPAWFEPGAPPIEVDFGCHRGTFLLGMAEKYPGINFLGIEKQSARVEKCLGKIRRQGLGNALAVQGEGAAALVRWLPERSVSIVHVSFPDPWPKRRHASRRLVTRGFLEGIERALCPGGVLRLMTDDASYFSDMKALLRQGWAELPWEDGVERPVTAFEKTFLERGRRPCRCAVRPLSRR